MTNEEMKMRLRQSLSPSRYQHTLGVSHTAKRLSGKWSVDSARAEVAGLLHDCAKAMTQQEMLDILSEMHIFPDENELRIPSILHAPAGAALAKRDYGMYDEEVLSAIRRHTIGGKGLTPLETLIYVSDFIEPTRKPFEGLERARALAEEDLFQAARLCARLSADYVLSRGGLIHPATLEMIYNTEECI